MTYIKLLVSAAFAAISSAAVAATTAVAGLTVEGRVSPQGIDVAEPRFGWQIESDGRNVVQRSYRVLVATTAQRLAEGRADVWDSHTVNSDRSQWVAMPKNLLKPNTRYFWRVQVATNAGRPVWSDVAAWTTGLLSPSNWRGSWIGLDSLMPWDAATRHSRLSTRYLRKEFRTAAKKVRRATIHISGLGNYTLYINGQRVGEDILTPSPTDYTKTVIYNTYDVTGLISRRNAIGVMLAGGHYFAQTQNYQANVRTTYGYPKLIANLIIEYADGTTGTIVTDGTWSYNADGPMRFSNEYDGEFYDARRQLGRWLAPGYDDSRWMKARVVDAPGGTLRGNLLPAMGVYHTDKPVAVRRYGNRYILDFGTNGAGRIRLKLRGNAGDTITIRHAELLERGDSTLYVANLRGAMATAWYVSDGKERMWTTEFAYYGFRYAEITGAGSLSVEDITRQLIADRMDDAGTGFSVVDATGNDMLNRIVANARRGIRSNYKGMPVDCPQRDERMPWLGDRTTGCFGESYMMNNHSLYAKWVADICDSQRPDGSISDVSPAYWRLYRLNITWPAALPFSCHMLYRQYGDIRPMQNSYPAIKKFLGAVRKNIYSGGLITYDRYGDWCVPPESPKLVHSEDPARKTDGRLLSSTYYYYLCSMMQRYAEKFGYTADAGYFGREAAATLKAVNDTFLVAGRYSNGTATANLLPLAMGIVPEAARKAVADSLISTIVNKNNTHISSGVIGIQWLMRYLSESGRGDIAYRLASTSTYPSWGYMVERGATTIWELWNGDTARPSMNSGNHVMLLGDLLVWCYEYLGGIRPSADKPGFKHIVLRPDFSIADISGVTASHPTPYGMVRSSWTRESGRIRWKVSVPANTTAEVHLPSGKVEHIGSGTYEF